MLQVVEAYFAVEAVQPGQAQGAGVAFFAHIGGFVTGLLLALVVRVASGPSVASSHAAAH